MRKKNLKTYATARVSQQEFIIFKFKAREGRRRRLSIDTVPVHRPLNMQQCYKSQNYIQNTSIDTGFPVTFLISRERRDTARLTSY